jgi:hypothetical protein
MRHAISLSKNNIILQIKFNKGGQSMTTTAVKNAATIARVEREPLMLRKQIGSATFKVTVHFSNDSKETMEDKILRLIEREVNKSA